MVMEVFVSSCRRAAPSSPPSARDANVVVVGRRRGRCVVFLTMATKWDNEEVVGWVVVVGWQ
jgi:hypothetical protein